MTGEEAISCIERIIDENGIYGTSPLTPHAIDALRTAISALESQRWIPVTERLPEKDDRVLVYIPEIGGANCSVQISKGWSMKYVSHWMPLPSTEGLNDSKL